MQRCRRKVTTGMYLMELKKKFVFCAKYKLHVYSKLAQRLKLRLKAVTKSEREIGVFRS